MSGFVTKLVMREAGDEDDGRWVLVEDLVYDSDVAACRVIVPAGFETDLASVPRLPIIYALVGGVADRAAVIHDYLYTLGKMPRSLADDVLREAAACTGVSGWRRFMLWAGVRIGGAGRYAESDGEVLK